MLLFSGYEKGNKMGTSDLKIVQDYLLEMVIDINKMCNEENIPLFAVGGTLLGAVRYKGFIPWDDDLDFGMKRSDLPKLAKLLEESDKYDLHIPELDSQGNYVRFPKILRKNTIFKQTNDDVGFDQRLFIDIFTIENVPNNPVQKLIHGVQSELLSMIGSYVFFTTDGRFLLGGKSKPAQLIVQVIGKLFGFKSYSYWNAKAFQVFGKYTGKKTDNVTLPGGAKHYFGEILSQQVFGEGSKIDFCNIQIDAPKDIHGYLLNRYGSDYMTPPSVENQMNHRIVYFKVDGKEIIK